MLGLIRSKAGIPHEQDEVVMLLGFPSEVRVRWLLGILPRCLIELLVFGRTEPRPVRDLSLRLIWRRQIRQMAEPFVANGSLENLPEGSDLIMQGATGRHPAGSGRGNPVDPVILNCPGVDVGKAHLAEERDEMQPETDTVPLNPFRTALALRDDPIFLPELLGGFRERGFCFQYPRRSLAAQPKIPFLGDDLRLIQPRFFGAGAVLAALYGGRAVPGQPPRR